MARQETYHQLLDIVVKSGLTPTDKVVLLTIISYTPIGSDTTDAPLATLCERACVSTSTAKTSIKRLSGMSLVTVKGGGNSATRGFVDSHVRALQPPPSGQNLTGQNLTGQNLTGQNLTTQRSKSDHSAVKIWPVSGQNLAGEMAQVPEIQAESPPVLDSIICIENILGEDGLSQDHLASLSEPSPWIDDEPEPPEPLVLTIQDEPKTAPKIEAIQQTKASLPTIPPKPSIDDVSAVYGVWVSLTADTDKGRAALQRQTMAKDKRLKLINYHLQHEGFSAQDLIDAVRGAFGDAFWGSQGLTDLEQHILKDAARVRMLMARAKKGGGGGHEYRNTTYSPVLADSWARAVRRGEPMRTLDNMIASIPGMTRSEAERLVAAADPLHYTQDELDTYADAVRGGRVMSPTTMAELTKRGLI